MPRGRVRREPVFADAGVFLGFLLREDEDAYSRAQALFAGAEAGTLRIETSALALAEVVRVLEQRARLVRARIAEVVETILGTRNLRVHDAPVLRAAARLYADRELSFDAACDIAYMLGRGIGGIATFDRARYAGVADLGLVTADALEARP